MKVGHIRDYFIRGILKTDTFQKVHENIMPMNELMAYYRCAIMEVETKFKVLNEEFSLQYDRNPIETIKSRLKSADGIVEKYIKDVAGVRVICSFEEDIYLLADCLLKQDDIVLLEMKDYFKNPKENGYRSLHLIVEVPIFLKEGKKYMKVEVQLRTIAMDFWATLEHKLRYKKNIKPEILEELSQELYDCAEMTAKLDAKMSLIKNRLSQENGEEIR